MPVCAKTVTLYLTYGISPVIVYVVVPAATVAFLAALRRDPHSSLS